MKRVLLGAARTGVGIASILLLITFFTVYILPVFGAEVDAVNLVSPGNDTWTSGSNDTINFTFNYTGENLTASCELFIDSTGVGVNGTVLNNTNTVINANTSISDGTHYWNMTCTNSTSQTSDTWILKVDTGTPAVTFVSPAANYNSSSANISFAFNVTDSSSSTLNCSLYINGTLNTYNSSTMNATNTTFQVTGLSEASDQNWTVNCTDDSNNSHQPTVRVFTADATAPVFTSFTCSPSPVYTGDTVTCSCSATDATSGVETTSFTINPSTLIAGTQTTPCTVTDYAGNQNSTTASYTVNVRGSGYIPGTGPGTQPTTTKPDVIQSWDKIEPGAAVSMNIEKEGLDFTQIRVEVRNKANDVRISVTKLAAQPADVVHNVTGRVYQYVEIERSSSINDTNIQAASIRFRVNNTWISANNIDKNKVYMNRYANNQWNRLTTTLVTEDANHVYYSAVTPGFSTFVVTGEAAAAQVCTPDAKRCSGDDLQQCMSDGSAWETTETCQYGCDPTALTCRSAPQPVCTASAKRCVGDNLEQCSSDGMQWDVSETCTYGCDSAALTCKSAPVVTDIWLYVVIIAVIIIIIIYVLGTKNLRKKLQKI